MQLPAFRLHAYQLFNHHTRAVRAKNRQPRVQPVGNGSAAAGIEQRRRSIATKPTSGAQHTFTGRHGRRTAAQRKWLVEDQTRLDFWNRT